MLASSSQALDIRYGQGDFEWSTSIKKVIDSSVILDDKIFGINEQHQNFDDSTWYYFGNIDIHSSKKLDTITEITGEIVNIVPIDENDLAPFSSSFEVSGMDLDIGIGYDIYQNQKSFFGVGLMTGISTPFMEAYNYVDSTNALYNLLKDTSTNLDSYKFGITMQGAYNLATILSIYGSGSLALQTGTMSNEILRSSIDMTGLYSSFDVGFKYYLTDLSGNESDFYAKVGYAYKNWQVDDMNIDAGDSDLIDVASTVETEMTSDYIYLGIGFNF